MKPKDEIRRVLDALTWHVTRPCNCSGLLEVLACQAAKRDSAGIAMALKWALDETDAEADEAMEKIVAGIEELRAGA